MYYKITNTESKVYKALHDLRRKEVQMEADNKKAVLEKVQLEVESFYGYLGQQNFYRVTHYSGFKFTDPKKVDPKIWIPSKVHDGFFIPNKRTKLGKELEEFLCRGLQTSWYSTVFKILRLNSPTKFKFPFVEILDNVIVVFLDDKMEPKDDNLIEITKREFNELITPSK
jgi:hypothetical protein